MIVMQTLSVAAAGSVVSVVLPQVSCAETEKGITSTPVVPRPLKAAAAGRQPAGATRRARRAAWPRCCIVVVVIIGGVSRFGCTRGRAQRGLVDHAAHVAVKEVSATSSSLLTGEGCAR